MYGEIGLFAGLLSIIILITFFVMANRLRRIMNATEKLIEYEYLKPENRKIIPCDKCGEGVSVSNIQHGLVNCPKCKNPVRVD